MWRVPWETFSPLHQPSLCQTLFKTPHVIRETRGRPRHHPRFARYSPIQYFWNPARCMPRCASAVFINVSQTKPVRRFSAMSMVIPVSMPITSWSYQLLSRLKAFTNPYLFQAAALFFRIDRSARRVASGRNGSDPPGALGTTVPSIGPNAGGPPHTTYPFSESDAVMPHR